jgi:N-glycosidase YbiA
MYCFNCHNNLVEPGFVYCCTPCLFNNGVHDQPCIYRNIQHPQISTKSAPMMSAFFPTQSVTNSYQKCLNCSRQASPGHQYCGKTCANKSSLSHPTASSYQKCLNCSKQASPGYQYCGKTCATKSSSSHSTPIFNAFFPVTTSSSSSSSSSSSANMCKQCNIRQSYPGSQYCSKTCRDTPNTPTTSSICRNLKNPSQLLYTDKPTICFYNNSEPFYEFTNFYPSPITIAGRYYPTVEHYFQSQKFTAHPSIQNQIIIAQNPRDAFNIAKNNASLVPKTWHGIYGTSQQVMKTGLQYKFAPGTHFANLLKSTGTARLVEHTINDNNWGDGGDGSGENRLGQLLEEIRATL